MGESNRQADALLTEHFRYTPLSLIDEIINAVNTIIYRAIDAIESGLFSIPPRNLGFDGRPIEANKSSAIGRPIPSPAVADEGSGQNVKGYTDEQVEEEKKEEIENGVHALETLLEATVDKTFDKFEIYTLRNILTVPDELAPWMRLSHYENLTLPLPTTAPTPESIHALRSQLQETKRLNRVLRFTEAQNAFLLASLTSLLSPAPPTDNKSQTNNNSAPFSLAFLTSQPLTASSSPGTTSAGSSSKSLTTHAQFASSHLPALRALLAELQPKLDLLRETDGMTAGRMDWESKREERRKYLDQRVRKIVGGEGAGKVVGEGEVSGAKVRAEEVGGLENV
ncbi:hypothetical protein MMC07_008583, partial [Pseudocyphellaria aurata]|nr:hypothetical protein [Pseudocyphellaria aurata]